MATFIKGTGQPRLISSGGVSVDRYGLATATAVWWGWRYQDLASVTSVGKTHPSNALVCERISIDGDPGRGFTATASYAGILAPTSPVIELDMGMTEAPIETHPDFETFAGTGKATARNGAIFRKEADTSKEVFYAFGADAPATWRGVRSYLIPTAIVRRVTISTNYPSAGDLGRRSSPPATFGIPGDWIKTGVSAEKRGGVFTLREEWRCSGPGGWNPSIYK